MKMICQVCGREIDPGDRVGRRDDCPHCSADLHACRQCRHYAPGYHNDCRENQADRVVDKETANFCDFFQPSTAQAQSGPEDAKAAADKAWEELFGKK